MILRDAPGDDARCGFGLCQAAPRAETAQESERATVPVPQDELAAVHERPDGSDGDVGDGADPGLGPVECGGSDPDNGRWASVQVDGLSDDRGIAIQPALPVGMVQDDDGAVPLRSTASEKTRP